MNGQDIINWAKTKLGIQYVWGGQSDSGYDCSGLVMQAYSANGVSVNRTAQQQYDGATKISLDQAKPGDLLFFHTSSGGDYVSHVGIYEGKNENGEYVMIHAPKTGDVVKEQVLSDYYLNALVGAGTYGNSATDSTVSSGGTSGAATTTNSNNSTFSGWVADKLGVTDALASLVTGIVCFLLVGVGVLFFCQAFDIKIKGA